MSYRLHVTEKAKATAHRASSPFESQHPLASRARRACSRHLTAASIIALLAAGVASPAHATYPGENGVIVTLDLQSNQMVKINSDGAFTALGYGAQPTVSPSGKRIAYVINGDIYVMNIDGTGATNITNNAAANNHSPTWSPDGSKIAFVSYRWGVVAVFTMNSDGSSVARMTSGAWNGTQLAWSPKSDRLAYAYNKQIRVMNLDGTGDVLLAQGGSSQGGSLVSDLQNPKWGPEGTSVVFDGCMPGCPGDYWPPPPTYLRGQCGWNELAPGLQLSGSGRISPWACDFARWLANRLRHGGHRSRRSFDFGDGRHMP